jgi:hypothetical protein
VEIDGRFSVTFQTRVGILLLVAATAIAQEVRTGSVPDPREIPVPPIRTSFGRMPGVNELPIRKGMPDVMVMNNGTRVTNSQQWRKRREELKRILAYYAVGQMPPPPKNVKGTELRSEMVLAGTVKYRLVHLTFGPRKSSA